jgi:di-N-acetylchitobiase
VEVPFRGVNCSDAVGHEVEFFNLMALLDARQNSTPLLWDDSTQTPYFNFIDSATGLTNQVWFDNADSLRLKYQSAKRLGVRGTGPFTFSDLDSDGSKSGNPHAPAEAREMWQALQSFL